MLNMAKNDSSGVLIAMVAFFMESYTTEEGKYIYESHKGCSNTSNARRAINPGFFHELAPYGKLLRFCLHSG